MRFVALMLAALTAPAADLRIDHVTVAGSTLAPMRAGLEKLGVHVEYGGPHSNRATEMAIASFPDGSYVELIAFQPKADPQAAAAHYWTEYMKSQAGPCAWAVRSPDVAVEADRLRASAVTVSGLNKSGRTRPDGLRLDWQTARVGDEGNGVFFPFLIQDLTPRDRRAYPSGKPGNPNFPGVSKVVVAVKDLDQAIARFRKAYNLPAPRRESARAWFEGTPVVLTLDPSRVTQFGEGVSAILIRANIPIGGRTVPFFGRQIQWLNPDAIGPNRLALEY